MDHPAEHRHIVPPDDPELRILAWNRDVTRPITAEEAFGIYERNWRHVDTAAMTDRERRLVADLAGRPVRSWGHADMRPRTPLGRDVEGQPIKFEIVREARITLSGEFNHRLGCPLLNLDDQSAEKLLANADRCHDSSVRYRDAFDLGMLVIGNGGQLPQIAFDKSVPPMAATFARS